MFGASTKRKQHAIGKLHGLSRGTHSQGIVILVLKYVKYIMQALEKQGGSKLNACKADIYTVRCTYKCTKYTLKGCTVVCEDEDVQPPPFYY